MTIKEKEINHIKRHLKEFQVLTARETVEEYFDEYCEVYKRDGDNLYFCLCSDLQIKPLKGLDKGWGQ